MVRSGAKESERGKLMPTKVNVSANQSGTEIGAVYSNNGTVTGTVDVTPTGALRGT